MKTTQIIITLLCLLLSAIVGQLNVALAQESPQVQQDNERHQNILRSTWDGRVAMISTEALLRDPEFRAALGVTDNYYREIQTSVQNAVRNLPPPPELIELGQRRESAYREAFGRGQPQILMGSDPGLPKLNELNEEQLKAFNRYEELQPKVDAILREIAFGADRRSIAAFEEALSPELKQQIQEAWLAAMDETSMFSPNWFEVLNLTDAQKQQMERIKKELEPELEKHLEIYGSNAAKILERVNAALRQPEAQREIADVGLNVFMRKFEAESEHKKLLDESYASSKALATLFRTRMLEVLDEEQRKRLQVLFDNPPPHAQYLIRRMRREQWGHYAEGENKKVDVSTEVWVPGPDSWRPGDPLPESFLRERETKGNFPRQEN